MPEAPRPFDRIPCPLGGQSPVSGVDLSRGSNNQDCSSLKKNAWPSRPFSEFQRFSTQRRALGVIGVPQASTPLPEESTTVSNETTAIPQSKTRASGCNECAYRSNECVYRSNERVRGERVPPSGSRVAPYRGHASAAGRRITASDSHRSPATTSGTTPAAPPTPAVVHASAPIPLPVSDSTPSAAAA